MRQPKSERNNVADQSLGARTARVKDSTSKRKINVFLEEISPNMFKIRSSRNRIIARLRKSKLERPIGVIFRRKIA